MGENIKIAVVCDWLVTLAGAEKVLQALLRCFPQADLFAVIDFLNQDQRSLLTNKPIHTTFIQKLPWAKTKYRHYLPLMPLAIEQLDLSAYHIIISSSHAVAKGVITGPHQLHICYIHSPMRYAWDLQWQYLRESGLDQKWYGWIARYLLHRLRQWDLRSASGVDYFIANSNYIAKRVQKTYKRTAEVIYPPVQIPTLKNSPLKKENFYVTASRLVPYKRVDLIVNTFKTLLPEQQLVVIGDGPEMKKIQQLKAANVQLLGYQPNEVLLDYLQRAKAFIFAAEEDFGILPLEAQACGTPIIAYGKGGALETVRDLNHIEPTGLFFFAQTPTSLFQVIKDFEAQQNKFTPENCKKNAARFHPDDFATAIKATVQKQWELFQPSILQPSG